MILFVNAVGSTARSSVCLFEKGKFQGYRCGSSHPQSAVATYRSREATSPYKIVMQLVPICSRAVAFFGLAIHLSVVRQYTEGILGELANTVLVCPSMTFFDELTSGSAGFKDRRIRVANLSQLAIPLLGRLSWLSPAGRPGQRRVIPCVCPVSVFQRGFVIFRCRTFVLAVDLKEGGLPEAVNKIIRSSQEPPLSCGLLSSSNG